MRIRSPAILCLLLATPAGPVLAQVRGIDLFGAMLTRPLAPTTGTTWVSWLPAGGGYLETDSLSTGPAFFRVDPESGRRSPLFDARTRSALVSAFHRLAGGTGDALPFSVFTFERNGRAIAFQVGADHFLFDLDRLSIRRLWTPDRVGPLDEATTEAARFSPDFNHYAFIRDYDNLYLMDTRTGREEQLVTGTSENNLTGFLGAGPWFVWSPDGRRIAYFTADQRGLFRYPILHSLDRRASVERFRYPFSTDPNPVLTLHLVDIASKTRVTIATSSPEQPFLRDIVWFDDGREVTFQVLNQWESRLELKAADPETGRVRTLLVDEVDTYLDPLHNFRQLDGGRRFTWSSERTGWRHIYLYDRSGKQLRQLTGGAWDTGEIAAVDERRGWVYFTGATELGLEHHFFRVRLDGSGLARLTSEPGMHRASMDPGAEYLSDAYSSLTTAPAVVLRRADGTVVRGLATTDVSAVDSLGLRPPDLLTLKAADGSTVIHGILFKPADFDSTTSYPVVVNVDGGPHTKAVRNRYETLDYRATLAQLGFLVAEFDARGTLDRGKAFQAGNYLRLGQVDVDDQAAAMRQLAARPYVDGTRVGVTGISHGGYMTLMMMLRYPDVFQVGAAGAPITDLRNGPRQYIGRIMRTPEANPDGYEKADVLRYADRLRGRLLLYHGTNDRNAVLGNTLQLARRLIDAGRPVDMMIYPEGVHVLEGRDAAHGLRLVVGYLLEHLKPEGWERSRAALWAPKGGS